MLSKMDTFLWFLLCQGAVVSAAYNYTVVLREGESITPTKEFTSPSGTYKLTLGTRQLKVQQLCSGKEPKIVFATFPHTEDLTELELSRNDVWLKGEYSVRTDTTVWATETGASDGRHANPKMTLADDGFLRLCGDAGCYWESSGLVGPSCVPENPNGSVSNGSIVLEAGQTMQVDHAVHSPNRQYKVALQSDGNVVVMRLCDEMPMFSTITNHADYVNVSLKADGNFAVEGTLTFKSWYPVWYAEPWKKNSPAREEYSNSELRLYDDGFLYQCNVAGCFWRSGFIHDIGKAECGSEVHQARNATATTPTAHFSDKLAKDLAEVIVGNATII